MTAFEEFGVLPELASGLDEMDWMLPTDIQAEGIPAILGGGDVLLAAETGSGKTGAFCIPIIQIVWETLKDIAEGKMGKVSLKNENPWLMSLFDRGNALAVAPDGLRCQSREFKDWHGCRATSGVKNTGKYYYEAYIIDEGLCRVGWSTKSASLNLGTDNMGFGFGGTGKKSNNNQFDNYGQAFGLQDTIGCLLDLTKNEISFTKNGTNLGIAFNIPNNLKGETFYPTVVLKNAEIEFNFGLKNLKCPPSNDFIKICDASPANIQYSTRSAAASTDLKPKTNAPQAIIIEPSRELAEQTFAQIQKFKKNLNNPSLRELLLIGGVNVKEQMSVLQKGVDIIVATPGRLEDLISNGSISLDQCRFFVLDEADGLLKQGHEGLITRLHGKIPKITCDGRRLQMIVCSATLHSFEVKKMADRLMHFPTWIDLKGEDSVPETVHHVVVVVNPQTDDSWQYMKHHVETDAVHAKDNVRPGNNTAETLSEAVKKLKGEYCLKAMEEHKMDRAIIFCRTKIDCDNLERYLHQAGNGKYKCVCLHGDRAPAERKDNLERFKNKVANFLICTDVAARGLDITGLPFMINITLPDEKSNYVHRIGRVGRAERMGLAISLVSSVPEKVWYHGQWCSSRGRNCWNTRLVEDKGCCIWYNEKNYLAEIEDHLNITIPQVGKDMKVPMNEFDGKVIYGEKSKKSGTNYKDHVIDLEPALKQLEKLEKQAQTLFLKRLPVS